MPEENNVYRIGIPIYNGVDLMDVAAPYEIFNWMGTYWEQDPVAPRSVKVELLAASCRTVRTRDGMILTPDATFNEVEDYLDLLWVPGGGPDQLSVMMKDPVYLGFLKRQAEGAGYVTSVCEGALLLASAGLLDGYEATTHWAFIPCLKSFCEVKVADGYPRFVVDRNRVTGGGISSGIDESLELVARISSYEIAKQVQLVTQYFPRPPFTGDIPGADTCPLDS
ncbi:MAG TPA: DJ-1/PfpI family protein [Blastocatellia bacterium]|nr:DJ-1/PfpI family protein [Blastocatellia bacterium]